jgi:hypothetical protein
MIFEAFQVFENKSLRLTCWVITLYPSLWIFPFEVNHNIFISSKSEVKIDEKPNPKASYSFNYCSNPTEIPADEDYISAYLKSLSTIMLQMMNEMRETLEASSEGWSAEAVHFVEATASATPDELSDVSLFNLYSGSLLRLASISS